ncbi:MAG: hypothetical protein R6W88_04070 [Desulfobacterales bacterium]
MKEAVFIFIITILLIVSFFMIFTKKTKAKNRDEVYICSHCGERDCICHKQPDAP